jgi:hypothetical protein
MSQTALVLIRLLHIAKDHEYLLQNHIENIIAQIKEELAERKISKKYLLRELETSNNQIQLLLNPEILNKNLTQIYKLANLLGLQFKLCLKAALRVKDLFDKSEEIHSFFFISSCCFEF